MAQLIDKDALVAEIKRLAEVGRVNVSVFDESRKEKAAWLQQVDVCDRIISFINTLEVNEVDLEKEIQNVIHNHFFDLNGIAIAGTSSYATVDDMVNIAKHFFELGLKAKQG